MSRVFQGATDAEVFEDFIEQVLQHCNRWPEPKSVLVMDNASFHRTENIQRMCLDAGVELIYLPPYLQDLNPIEDFFSLSYLWILITNLLYLKIFATLFWWSEAVKVLPPLRDPDTQL
jgi:transposase